MRVLTLDQYASIEGAKPDPEGSPGSAVYGGTGSRRHGFLIAETASVSGGAVFGVGAVAPKRRGGPQAQKKEAANGPSSTLIPDQDRPTGQPRQRDNQVIAPVLAPAPPYPNLLW